MMRQAQGQSTTDVLPAPPGRPGILIVDDEAMIRNVLEELLERRGFRVWTAENGRDAFEIYRRYHDAIAVVLLEADLLPEPNGPQILEILQHMNPCVRCCFMNSSPWVFTESGLLDLGAERVFQKPFAPAEITSLLWEIADPMR
jgi:DNA-binding response OmpR family regulator